MGYENCTLCPRMCGADRTKSVGYCGATAGAPVARTMIHKWEEPALAGSGGSGAIFFGGCSLGCLYCQNRKISRRAVGEVRSGVQLRAVMEELIASGAENIDLVTPTHCVPTIAEALEQPLPVPVVYNSSGYERVETLHTLEGKIDIYLPDFKYADPALARELSRAEDYPHVVILALKEMVRQVGKPVWEGERLKKGVIVRHLILPGQVENSLKVLDCLGTHFRPGEILVSLMRQYTPMPGMQPPFDRRVTDLEYDAVLSWMYLNDLEGFIQDAEAARESFIPDF